MQLVLDEKKIQIVEMFSNTYNLTCCICHILKINQNYFFKYIKLIILVPMEVP
jgi:hypothetical protein